MVSSMRLAHGLLAQRAAQLVGGDAVDGAVERAVPQRLLVLRRLERGIGVIDLPVRQLVVLGRVQHVLMQALAVDRQALGARLGDGRNAGAGRHVHHVERGAGHALGQPDDAAEAQVLRQRVVHLRHVLEADAALADQLGVHVHDDVVVLGVDDAEPALLGEHLERLPDVAEVDHPAGAMRPDVGGEDLDGRIAGLDRLASSPELRVRRLASASGGRPSRTQLLAANSSSRASIPCCARLPSRQ